MKKFMALAFVLQCLATTAMANSGAVFSLGIIPSSSDYKEDSDDGTQKISNTNYDLNIGIGMEFLGGLYLGGKALYWKGDSKVYINTESSGRDEYKTSDTITAYGVSIGYHNAQSIYVDFTYYISMGRIGKSDAGGADVTYEEQKGSAFSLDLGYGFKIKNWISFGPQLQYIQYTHKRQETKADVNGEEMTIENEGAFKNTLIKPYFGFWFHF